MSFYLFHQDDDDVLDRCPMCGARLRTFARPGVVSEECPQCPFKVEHWVDTPPDAATPAGEGDAR